MDDFEKELKGAFLEEAAQNLSDTEQCFLDLEKNTGDASILEKIFRLAHNLKGSAKAVGFDQLGSFTHELESFLLKVKQGDIPISSGVVDLLLRCNDHVNLFVSSLKADFDANVESSDLLQEIAAYMNGEVVEAQVSDEPSVEEPEFVSAGVSVEAPIATEMPQLQETAQVAEDVIQPDEIEDLETQMEAGTSEPEPVYFNSEDMKIVAEDAAPPSAGGAPPSGASAGGGSGGAAADESIRVSLARLEGLINYVGEMVILQSVLQAQVASVESSLMRKTVHQLGKVTKEVQEISMGLRMVPLKQTFQKMQRIVRDTSKALDKRVNFTIRGEDTELDKTVLEQLGDPLVHLIRNAVDHGLETEAERLEAGKPAEGNVYLSAFHRLGQVVIEIRDDGKGLDAKKLIAHAIKKGVIKSGDGMTDDQAHRLVFAPGFSTKEKVTDVSGRGVGMDVVRTNIERLHGDITIETEVGKGTVFRVRLPVTLAIIDGMVVSLGGERFVIPLSHVFEAVEAGEMKVQQNVGLGEVLLLRGENIPLHRLSRLLGRKSARDGSSDQSTLVIRTSDQPFAVVVDSILGQQQIVIKPLGNEIRKVKGFGGSAILGDGLPALILELQELVRKQPGSKGPALKTMGGVAA